MKTVTQSFVVILAPPFWMEARTASGRTLRAQWDLGKSALANAAELVEAAAGKIGWPKTGWLIGPTEDGFIAMRVPPDRKSAPVLKGGEGVYWIKGVGFLEGGEAIGAALDLWEGGN